MRPLLLLLLLFAATPAIAQVRPQPGGGDPRLQTVDYAPDQVVMLEAAPGYQLTVELSPDEQIENIAVGDSGGWQVTANRRGDRLFIKPLHAAATATNMTVITTARLYAIDLVPLAAPSVDMAYTVRFNYPEAPDAAPEAAPTVQGRYRLTGDRRLHPSMIGDDGRQTFIEWAAETPLPAVYGIDPEGREMLLNGMMRDGVFVIDSVLSALVFRTDRRTARALRVLEEER